MEDDLNITKSIRKRRSKTDQMNRAYKCGCGRTYLSYPALYTHLKNKHDGEQPEGTNAPSSTNGRGRGRPKKITNLYECDEENQHPSPN